MAKKKLPKLPAHSLDEENVNNFIGELHGVLQKYNAHVENSPIRLETSNMVLRVGGIMNCRPECVKTVKYCDINGKNCYVEVTCEC